MTSLKVTVIVAVEYAERNLRQILDNIAPRRGSAVEVIICTANPARHELPVVADYDNVTIIKVARWGRIPHMWAAGIRAAQGSFVALTTAHCVPDSDWIWRIQELEMDADQAGIGGTFRNSRSASTMDWAIFLLRYRQFATCVSYRRDVTEIAADNALYRKNELLAYGSLLDEGFWEPEFHARFRSRGLRLALDPSLEVIHRNCYTFRQFAGQRIEHGKAFGRARAAKLSLLGNVALLLISPGLPLVFLGRVILWALRHTAYRDRTLRALPCLTFFIMCWGYGESKGYFLELVKRLTR